MKVILDIFGKTKYRNKSYVPRKAFSEETKRYVMKRQNGKCAECDEIPRHWEFHHIAGRDDNSISNCEGLCPNCHRSEHY